MTNEARPKASARHALTLVLVAAASLQPRVASCQERATARMAAAINTPVIMTDVHDMDFGNIAPRGNSGTVVMSPGANAQCNTTGGVIHTGTCRAATFEGKVTFLFGLRVTGPTGNQINLSGPGGATMRLDNFTFGSGPGMLDFGVAGGSHRFWILNLDGSYTIHAGGTLHVAANQTPGVYTGTFDIRLNYD